MRDSTRKTVRQIGECLTAFAILTSCAPAVQSGLSRSQYLDSASVLSLASANHSVALYSSQTTSLALDRIDQRQLPLDATYRRSGSGRGVTIYVFDGGILPTHPELEGRVRV